MHSKKAERKLKVFEKYLTVWVIICIIAGIGVGTAVPDVGRYLDRLAIYVNEAPVVSIPIAVCLFFMMYPIMVKIDFAEVLKAGKSVKPVGLTLFANWAIGPFAMYGIALFFLGFLFKDFIGAHAYDFVKLPLGADWDVGSRHGAGIVVLHHSGRMLLVPLWWSYLAGCIHLGIAPCTAMVLVWGYLSRGNDGHTLVMVEQQRSIDKLNLQTADLKVSLEDMRARVDLLGNKFILLQEKIDSSRADIDRINAAGASQSMMPPAGLTVVPLAEEELRYNPGPAQKGHTMKKETGQASPEAMYNKGQDLFMAGRYEESRAAFSAFLKAYPRHNLSDNASYWVGEAYYAEKDFLKALEKFTETADKYPSENKAPDALLKADSSA